MLYTGLWNSLGSIIGAGTFDFANSSTCWSVFHASGLSFGADHANQVAQAKIRYASCLARLERDPDPDCALSSEPCAFGFGVQKLQKSIQSTLKQLACDILIKDANSLPQDDHRASTFLASINNPYANSFPNSIVASDLKMSNMEYQVAFARKLGLPISILCPYVGTIVRASGNSARTHVDVFGDGVASAPGVKGDHFRRFHDRCVTLVVNFLNSAKIPTEGGHRGTCKGTFSKSFQAPGILSEEDERLLQGIIPDAKIDARDCRKGPFDGPNRLLGKVSLVEHKLLASCHKTVDEREEEVRRNLVSRAQRLDAKYPGSTFERDLRSFGDYVVLVSGALVNLSRDWDIVVDLIARERAMRTLDVRLIAPHLALAIQRRFLQRHIGFFIARGWAQHIIERWRSAVSLSSTVPSFENDSEVLREPSFVPEFDSDLRGRYFPAADVPYA